MRHGHAEAVVSGRAVLGTLFIAMLLTLAVSSCGQGGGEERAMGGVEGVALQSTKEGLKPAANSSFWLMPAGNVFAPVKITTDENGAFHVALEAGTYRAGMQRLRSASPGGSAMYRATWIGVEEGVYTRMRVVFPDLSDFKPGEPYILLL